jgi:hypothetical protein
MEQTRELIFYQHYFHDFFNRQTEKVKEKIDYVLFMLTHTDRVPEKFLKHMEGHKGLYEIRIEAGNNIFRIFCCFDKGRLLYFSTAFKKRHRKLRKVKLN